MGWTLHRYPTIQSGIVYRWECGDAEISASRDGFSIGGEWPVLQGAGTLLAVQEILNAAEITSRHLARGEYDPPKIGRFVVRNPPTFHVSHPRVGPVRHPEQVTKEDPAP